MSVINMVDGSDNCRIISMAQMIDIQCVADLLDAVLNIQAGSAVGICLRYRVPLISIMPQKGFPSLS